MIASTLDWILKVNEAFHLKPKRVLDIGSLDYNGNPKHLFSYSRYTGIDIKAGPNVDVVLDVSKISTYFQRNYFDAVLCLCFLEHVKNIFDVLDQVKHALKPSGHFYVSIPGLGYPKHDYPNDYWRVTEPALRDVIMMDYTVLSLEHTKSEFSKHPMMCALGVQNATVTTANQDT